MAISTTITFADIVAYHRDELDEAREAYDELLDYAREEHGDERAEWPDDIVAVASILDEHAKTIQQRINFIQRVADEYDGSEFTLKMLSGRELSEIETELRMTAQKRDTDPESLTAERKMETVDRAVTKAPEGFPHDDGDPRPSDAPNPLALSLHEQVQLLNQSGETDFRAEGFADELLAALPATSDNPSDAAEPSSVSKQIDAASPPSGDSSSEKPTPD